MASLEFIAVGSGGTERRLSIPLSVEQAAMLRLFYASVKADEVVQGPGILMDNGVKDIVLQTDKSGETRMEDILCIRQQ